MDRLEQRFQLRQLDQDSVPENTHCVALRLHNGDTRLRCELGARLPMAAVACRRIAMHVSRDCCITRRSLVPAACNAAAFVRASLSAPRRVLSSLASSTCGVTHPRTAIAQTTSNGDAPELRLCGMPTTLDLPAAIRVTSPLPHLSWSANIRVRAH